MTQNITAHNLGFCRAEADPEFKVALDAYWLGNINPGRLEEVARQRRRKHWQLQADAGLDLITTGDFAWFDPVLSLSATLGNIPERHRKPAATHIDVATLFRAARGHAPGQTACRPSTVAKWFDNKLDYLVPEFHRNQHFALSWTQIIDETQEAAALGYAVKPVIIGPLTYLWLGTGKESNVKGLDLMENLLPAYQQLLSALAEAGAEWVQIDEPILALDLPSYWQRAFEKTYHRLQTAPLKILLATYFGALGGNITSTINLPVAGLHIDMVSAPEQLLTVLDRLPAYKTLSLGVVDGNNIWRNNVDKTLQYLQFAQQRLGNRLWIAPSCALPQSPFDMEARVALTRVMETARLLRADDSSCRQRSAAI